MAMVIAIGIAGIILFSLTPTYLNHALGRLEDAIFSGGTTNADITFIFQMVGIFLGLILINEIFAVICAFLILDYEKKGIQQYQINVKRKLDVVPIRFLEKYDTGDLSRIVCYNTPDMLRNVLLVTYQIARASFFFITTSIAMFGINWILALVVIGSLPIAYLTARFVSSKTQKHFRHQNLTNTYLNTFLDRRVSMHGFYREHGLDTDSTEFNKKIEDHRYATTRELTAVAFNTIYITFIRNFMFLLITVLCCVLFLNGMISIVALPTFLLFSQRFLDNIVVVTTATNILQLMEARAKYIFKILDTSEDITQHEHIEINKIKGDIEFKKVTLQEDDNILLNNVSFKIPHGGSVAIVGPTGSGKHRVVELLSKMGNPTHGTITIDGVNLSEIKSSSFYRRMGVASDRPFIFKGTVADNILYGIGRALPERVMGTTKRLGSHGFIEQLPRGYDTEINSNTNLISISQKQAINVARTVLQSPDLVIIDSALSMADNMIERQVFDEIMKSNKNQTKVFVTGRLGSVQNCDLIIYMENGKIREKGTHKELMTKKGKYFKSFTGT